MRGPSQIQPDDSQSGRQLEVARIGGGPSARVGAVVVAGILIGIIGIAISGRPPAPAAAPASPAVAAAATASPIPPSPSPARPTPQPIPTRWPVLETYGVSLRIGAVQYVTSLSTIGTSRMFADLRVPYPPGEPNGVLSFNQLSTDQYLLTAETISEWRISLKPLSEATRNNRTVLVDVTVPARPKQLGLPMPVRRGYQLTVYATNDLLFGVITVEVTLGPKPGIDGDDGILGWPTTPR